MLGQLLILIIDFEMVFIYQARNKILFEVPDTLAKGKGREFGNT